MDNKEFKRLLESTYCTLESLTDSKGKEYSHDADQLANFKRQAAELGVSPLMVLAVYLNKHLDAVKSFIKNGKEFSEPIEGRIDDAILYLILLKALISDLRSQQSQSNKTPISEQTRQEFLQSLGSKIGHAQITDTRPQFELK